MCASTGGAGQAESQAAQEQFLTPVYKLKFPLGGTG